MSKNVNDLFSALENDGDITQESKQALVVADMGADIQAALGIDVDMVEASEVVLVTQIIDDSSSIQFGGNKQVMIDGHNLVLDSVSESKMKDNVLAHTRLMHAGTLMPYGLIDSVIHLDGTNYRPSGDTPLFDATVATLGAVLAKAKEFEDNGVAVRTITLIATDGGENASRNIRHASEVASVVRDMLQAETHIIAGMGIDDNYTDFQQVFSEMGIPDEWILTPGNTEKEIRAAFQLFSSSATRASQDAQSFSNQALGGFGKTSS